MASVTGQQRIHPILPQIVVEVRVCSAPVLGFFVWNSDFGTLFVSPQFIVKENCCHTSSLCCFFWSSANPQTYTFMKYNFLNESRLLEQKYQEHWIKSSLRKCYGRYNSLVIKTHADWRFTYLLDPLKNGKIILKFT